MDTGKASPHNDLITTRGTARTVFNYICLFLLRGSHPQMPGLLPVIHSLHGDVPPTEGEEQTLYPFLSLQHQVLVRSHSHFFPESCNLENRTRAILSSEQPS